MEEPKLKDFNLKESDFAELERQKRAYYIAQKDNEKHVYLVSFIVGIIIAIVIGFIGAIVFNTEFFVVFGGCLFPGSLIYAFATDYFINEYNRNNSIRNIYVDKSLEDRIANYNHCKREYIEYKKRITRDFWLNLSPYKFESEVAGVFRKNGYESYVTKGSGDGGIDIVLKKCGERYAVQCKHHKNRNIGPAPIRELYGAMKANNFDGGFFVSLCGYSENAKIEAAIMNITLLTLNDLIIMNQVKEVEIKDDLEFEDYNDIIENTNYVVNRNSIISIKYLITGEIVKVTGNINRSSDNVRYIKEHSPLMQAIIGKEEGEIASYQLNKDGRLFEVEIIEIN